MMPENFLVSFRNDHSNVVLRRPRTSGCLTFATGSRRLAIRHQTYPYFIPIDICAGKALLFLSNFHSFSLMFSYRVSGEPEFDSFNLQSICKRPFCLRSGNSIYLQRNVLLAFIRINFSPWVFVIRSL